MDSVKKASLQNAKRIWELHQSGKNNTEILLLAEKILASLREEAFI